MSKLNEFEPHTKAKAEEVNENFNILLNGDYNQKLKTWSTDTRPDIPISNRTWGFNTDISGIEVFLGSSIGWFVINGIWSETPDADNLNLAPGSKGFNTNSYQWEGYDGEDWKLIG